MANIGNLALSEVTQVLLETFTLVIPAASTEYAVVSSPYIRGWRLCDASRV